MGVSLRCVYVDIDRVLRDELRERALEVCDRAEIEVVVWSAEERAAEAAWLGVTSWAFDGGLVIQGERHETDDPIAFHMRARGLAPEECLRVTDGSFYQAVIGEIMRRRG